MNKGATKTLDPYPDRSTNQFSYSIGQLISPNLSHPYK